MHNPNDETLVADSNVILHPMLKCIVYLGAANAPLPGILSFAMVVRQHNTREAGDSPFPSRPLVVKISSLAKDVNEAVGEPSLLSGQKLRNRIIFANAVVWLGIVVAIWMIFF